MRALLAAIVGLGVAMSGTAAAVTCVDSGFGYDSCVINNGLAPPTPENVIDDGTYDAEDKRVYVRDVGCPPNWGDTWVLADEPCPSPGEPTEVEVVEGGLVGKLYVADSSAVTMNGGTVGWYLRAYDSSTIMMNGGRLLLLYAYDSSSVTMDDGSVSSDLSIQDSSTVTMSGGTVEGDLWPQHFSTLTMSGGTVQGYLKASDSPTVTMSGGVVSHLWASHSSTVTMSGGAVGGQLTAYDSSAVTISGGTVGGALHAAISSTITVVGSDFEVDGAPVPYDDLTAETGTLTGTLASAEPIDNWFYQGGGSYTGTITLVEHVPEPTTALLTTFALLTLALVRRQARACVSP